MMLLPFLALFSQFSDIISSCPTGCKCLLYSATCAGLTSFPGDWFFGVKTIELSYASLKEIPSGAFAELGKLTHISIRHSTIDVIKHCAFPHLNGVEITIENCTINTIESYAFTDLDMVDVFFKDAFIGVIQSYSFVNIRNSKYFEFSELNITVIETHAFFNISNVSSMNYQANYFYEFRSDPIAGLHNVDLLILTESTLVYPHIQNITMIVETVGFWGFYNNYFYCDCRIQWMFESKALSKQGELDNQCYAPTKMAISPKVFDGVPCNTTVKDLMVQHTPSPVDPGYKCETLKSTTTEMITSERNLTTEMNTTMEPIPSTMSSTHTITESHEPSNQSTSNSTGKTTAFITDYDTPPQSTTRHATDTTTPIDTTSGNVQPNTTLQSGNSNVTMVTELVTMTTTRPTTASTSTAITATTNVSSVITSPSPAKTRGEQQGTSSTLHQQRNVPEIAPPKDTVSTTEDGVPYDGEYEYFYDCDYLDEETSGTEQQLGSQMTQVIGILLFLNILLNL